MAKVAAKYADVAALDYEYVDLRDFPLPLCDGDVSFGDANVLLLSEKLKAAQSIILAGAVYAYGISGAAKNMIDLTGKSWTGKPVGIMLAAGGSHSFMSSLGIANSLMLDYRCPIIPKFVYAESSDFDDGDLTASHETRIEELLKTTHQWGEVL